MSDKTYQISGLTEKQVAGIEAYLKDFHPYFVPDIQEEGGPIAGSLAKAGIKREAITEVITVVYHAGRNDYVASIPSPVLPGDILRWGDTAEQAVEAAKQRYLEDLEAFKPQVVGVEEWEVPQ